MRRAPLVTAERNGATIYGNTLIRVVLVSPFTVYPRLPGAIPDSILDTLPSITADPIDFLFTYG